ncbi:hypothetical protein Tco_1308539, partial [Tanacetum coccineum]
MYLFQTTRLVVVLISCVIDPGFIAITSIWLWWLGDLSWPVAGGGDDMATWLVPAALPDIPHNDWIKQKGKPAPKDLDWKHAVDEIKISDAVEDEKVGNKTSKIYNMDHAVCGLATCDVAKKYGNINGIEIENQLTVCGVARCGREAASAQEILFKGTSCSVIHEWNNISSSNSRSTLRLEQVLEEALGTRMHETNNNDPLKFREKMYLCDAVAIMLSLSSSATDAAFSSYFIKEKERKVKMKRSMLCSRV